MNDAPPLWGRLVLISGHRRSGSTWLAAALGEAEEARLIPYEPLWLKWHPGSPYADQITRWRSARGWHIDWNPTSAQDQADARALRQHLNWLCEHYFGGPVKVLLIKEPHPNWLAFLIPALQPDHLIYLRRHPLGIVNSYDKANLYTRWQVAGEWQSFCQALPGLFPELVPLAGKITHPAARVAFMAHVSDRLLERLPERPPTLVVDYEDLCLETRTGFQHIFDWLGWAWDEAVWARLQPLVEPEASERQSGFIQVRKRSQERAYAWRQELPAHLICRLRAVLGDIDASLPFPGEGLPPLTPAEQRRGWRTYLARRWAYLRSAGLQACLQSL